MIYRRYEGKPPWKICTSNLCSHCFFRKRFLTSSDFFWLFRDRSWPIRDFVKMLLISSDFFLNWGCIAFWIFCSDSHDAHEWYVVVRRSKKVRQKSRFVKLKSVISQTSNRGFIYRFLEVKLMISDWTVKNERWKLSFEIFTKKMKKIAKTNKKFRQILVFSSSPVICFETSTVAKKKLQFTICVHDPPMIYRRNQGRPP